MKVTVETEKGKTEISCKAGVKVRKVLKKANVPVNDDIDIEIDGEVAGIDSKIANDDKVIKVTGVQEQKKKVGNG